MQHKWGKLTAMNSLLARTTGQFSSSGVTNLTSRRRINRAAVKTIINYELLSTRFRARCYCSLKTAGVAKPKTTKSDSKPAAIMEQETNAFFVGVYKNLIDCQAQLGSSICDPPVSVYNGYTMPKEADEYLLSRGLTNAIYSIRAADLTELFGSLVPCLYQTNPKEYFRKFWDRKLGLLVFLSLMVPVKEIQDYLGQEPCYELLMEVCFVDCSKVWV